MLLIYDDKCDGEPPEIDTDTEGNHGQKDQQQPTLVIRIRNFFTPLDELKKKQSLTLKLKDELNHAKEDNVRYQNRIAELHEERITSIKKEECKQSVILKLESELNDMKEQNVNYKKCISELNEENSACQKRILELYKELNSRNKEDKEKQNLVSKLERELDEAKESKINYQKGVSELDQKNMEQTHLILDMETELSEMKNDNEKYQDRIAELEKTFTFDDDPRAERDGGTEITNSKKRVDVDLDLHGCSVPLAIYSLEEKIRQLKAMHWPLLRVDCGKGKGSGPEGPKIRPTLIEHLKKEGWDFIERGGIVAVMLRRGEKGWLEDKWEADFTSEKVEDYFFQEET